MLCYVMLCYVMLCYVMLCYVMLCYVMLCYVTLISTMIEYKKKKKMFENILMFEICSKCLLIDVLVCLEW